jgi:Zn-finger protein
MNDQTISKVSFGYCPFCPSYTDRKDKYSRDKNGFVAVMKMKI